MFTPSLHAFLNLDKNGNVINGIKPWESFEKNFAKTRAKEGDLVFGMEDSQMIYNEKTIDKAIEFGNKYSQDVFDEHKKSTQVWFFGDSKIMRRLIEEKIVDYITICRADISADNTAEINIPKEYQRLHNENSVHLRYLELFTLTKRDELLQPTTE